MLASCDADRPLTAGRWPLTARRWMLAVCDADRWPLSAGRWPLTADRWPLAADRSKLTAQIAGKLEVNASRQTEQNLPHQLWRPIMLYPKASVRVIQRLEATGIAEP